MQGGRIMSVHGAPILRNVFGKGSNRNGNTVLQKLSKALNAAGKETENGAVAKNGVQKKDGFTIQSGIMEFLNPTAGLSEEEKQAYENKILQKLRSGKKLTSEEMNYLRVKNPAMYAQAARVQAMRENLKSQLESCRSKEEVEKVYGDAVSLVGKEDPMKEAIIAAYDDVTKEFKETDQYQALPEKEEDAENNKKSAQGGGSEDGDPYGLDGAAKTGRDLF